MTCHTSSNSKITNAGPYLKNKKDLPKIHPKISQKLCLFPIRVAQRDGRSRGLSGKAGIFPSRGMDKGPRDGIEMDGSPPGTQRDAKIPNVIKNRKITSFLNLLKIKTLISWLILIILKKLINHFVSFEILYKKACSYF